MTGLQKFNFSLFAFHFLLLTFLPACSRPAGFGMGGRYLDARQELLNPRGNMDKAIVKLEEVVRRDPFYRDSLTLLGRAYYRKRRYRDAFEILKRALAVNQRDEIAWIALGLTQLRSGDDERGLESLKGGLSLLAQVSKAGYRGHEVWDKKGLVRSALHRAIFLATKGLEEKRKLIGIGEILLARIEDEDWTLDHEEFLEQQDL